MLDQVLSTAEDFIIIGKEEDKVRFAFPLKGDVAKHYFDKSPGAKRRDVEGFNRHWEYNPKTGKWNSLGDIVPKDFQTFFLHGLGALTLGVNHMT